MPAPKLNLNIDYKDAKKRILAAKDLFVGSATTKDKVASLREMLKGIHPEVDTHLEKIEHQVAILLALQSGDVVQLSAEHMPETTEEEKKRKKALLLFLEYWGDLKGEVARVEKEIDSNNNPQKSNWGKIFSGVKGPLGIVTILAVGVVFAAQATAVKVEVTNNGCDSMVFPTGIPDLPGLAIPKEPIATGASATVTIPPLPVTFDNTAGRTAVISTVGFSGSYEIPKGVTAVTLDGVSLLGKKTEVNLLNGKNHSFSVTCSRVVAQPARMPVVAPVVAPAAAEVPSAGSSDGLSR